MTILRLAAIALTLALPLPPLQAAENLPPVEVFVPVPCLACIDWAEHLRQNGFTVTLRETADMAALKKRFKVPAAVESVHTARVGGYFIEGHVPAEDIKELLKEKPKARGLAVPGLPAGAPGREASSPTCERGCTVLESAPETREVRRELFDTLLVDHKGQTRIYSRH
ncbi:MAG TPA: DUF411 domain-containing protein [Azospira sp.]|nr:DUF411 domain-containing protein [Azospira sp.]